MSKDSKDIKAELERLKQDEDPQASGKRTMQKVIEDTDNSREKMGPKISGLIEGLLPATIGAAAGLITGNPEIAPTVSAAVKWTGAAGPCARLITKLLTLNIPDPRNMAQKQLAESDDPLARAARSALNKVAEKTGLKPEDVYSYFTFQLPPDKMDQFWDYFPSLVPVDAINTVLESGDMSSAATQGLLTRVLEDKAGLNLASLTEQYEQAKTPEGGKALVSQTLSHLLGDKCSPQLTGAVLSLIHRGIDAAHQKPSSAAPPEDDTGPHP